MPIYGWVAAAILVTGLLVLLIGSNGDTLLGVEPGQLAAVTAMLALLVYLGGGVFTRGQPVAPLLRYLLLWGGALIVLLVGYWGYQSVIG